MPRPCTMDDDEMDALEQCLEPFFDFIEIVLMNIIQLRKRKGTDEVNDTLEIFRDQLLDILDFLVAIEVALGGPDYVKEIVGALRKASRFLDEYVTDREARCWRLGRPRVKVDEQQLEFLVESNFRIIDIATIFDCSRRRVERRIKDLGLDRYTSISEYDLDNLVRNIVVLHSQCGEKSVLSRLRSEGVRVQRQKIRDSLHRVDPEGVMNRLRCALHRRQYTVRSPNSLWHLDGYHKLIRWKLVIHGAIDGFSRLIVYLKVSNNNRANTVLSAFTEAVREYGLPSRIRVDRGGENIRVSEYMLHHPERGPGRGSVIAGRSIHNQRIEKLWRDLYFGCICFFYNFFYFRFAECR